MRRFLLTVCLVAFLSNAAAAQMRVKRNVVYAQRAGSEARATSLDVYAPRRARGRPVMIWIHGGAWKIGDKRGVQEKPKAFVEKGFVFVSINYRLHPDADYRGQAADVAAAIRWAHDHAKEYGGSAEKIFIMGHSAGAHLAALVAIDDRYLRAEKLRLDTVKGVVLLDGACYDIPKQIATSFRTGKKIYTSVFGVDFKKQRDASPILHVKKGKGIAPFLIAHVADRAASKSQSNLLAAALHKADVKATVYSAKDKTHSTLNRELGLADDSPTKQMFEFMSRLLNTP